MTREKAIEVLENGAWWDLLIPITTIEGGKLDIELHEALDIAIAALRNGWISVEDRLPQASGKYLCVVKDKKGNSWTVPTEWSVEMRSWFGEFGEIKNMVTYWQPLPEPPEED